MKNKGAVTKMVVVFFGLIAAGKSFAAKAWAQKHRFPYYNTDAVRKQLAGMRSCEPHAAGFSEGIYTPACSRLTYDALLSFAEKELDKPSVPCVVLDGSYQVRAERDRLLRRLAHQARVVFVLCSCTEEVIKVRLAQRALDPAAVSDGSWKIYLRQKETFEYPEELSIRQFRRLDTDKEVHLLLDQLDDILQNEEEGDKTFS
jgi:predicted kinase